MDEQSAEFSASGIAIRFREGDRVFAGSFESEGVVLRGEDWGDTTVPVLLDDPDMVVKAPISDLLKV